MPGAIQIVVGTTTYSWPIKLTVTQIRAALRRHARRRGISVESLAEKEAVEAILRLHLKIIRDDAIDQQRAEAIQAQQAELETTLQSENDLYDEVTP